MEIYLKYLIFVIKYFKFNMEHIQKVYKNTGKKYYRMKF